LSSSGSVKLRYETCLEVWGNASGRVAEQAQTTTLGVIYGHW